jgi:hypothetical protein
MIAFKGRSYLRQYMPAKIVKWGFKLWALCDAVSGFCLKFDVYGGKRPGEAPAKKLGQCVVLELAQVVPRGSTIFADRYFSTVELVSKLKEEDIDYVGTIKENSVCYPGDLLRLPAKTQRGDKAAAVCTETGTRSCLSVERLKQSQHDRKHRISLQDFHVLQARERRRGSRRLAASASS